MKAIKSASPILPEEIPAAIEKVSSFINHVTLDVNGKYGGTLSPALGIGSMFSEEEGYLPDHPISDIDVAMLAESQSEITEKIKFFCNIFKWEYKIIPGLNVVSVGLPLADKTIQLDIMFVSNFKWAKFIYNTEKTSKYKAVYRNILLQSVIKTVTMYRVDDAYWCDVIQYPKGIYTVHKSFMSETGNALKKPRCIKSSFRTNDPDEIKSLYGLNGDISSFEKLYSIVKQHPDHFEIIECMAVYCRDMGLPVPEEILNQKKETQMENENLSQTTSEVDEAMAIASIVDFYSGREYLFEQAEEEVLEEKIQ